MKLVLISKKQFIYFSTFITFLIVLILLIIPNKSSKSTNVFNQIDIDKSNQVDLNGDGKKDTLSILSKNGVNDIEIISNNKTFWI